jgi:hypothetical protein
MAHPQVLDGGDRFSDIGCSCKYIEIAVPDI